jgi:hypothetical protein
MKRQLLSLFIFLVLKQALFSQLISDHTCTDITAIPESAIQMAKDSLHIAYGHTSHGSQITEGMTGLVDFANGGGKGLSLPTDIFEWNHGGETEALDLHDYAMDGDVGYYPQWYDATVNYLEDGANSDVNVIMWSWCGQVGSKYENGVLWEEYLGPMTALELAYPNIVFVYMTGHLDYWNHAIVNAANDSIRSYCRNNGKVLFDFADIESYSPDGTAFKDRADDGCNYYNEDDEIIGNWAIEYQDLHTEDVDWYTCGSQHSQPLNANRKAYAAWWLFASLGGWNYVAPPTGIENTEKEFSCTLYPNPANTEITIKMNVPLSELQYIQLFTANGRQISKWGASFTPNEENILTINTAGIQPGLYFMHIVTATDTRNVELTIAH